MFVYGLGGGICRVSVKTTRQWSFIRLMSASRHAAAYWITVAGLQWLYCCGHQETEHGCSFVIGFTWHDQCHRQLAYRLLTLSRPGRDYKQLCYCMCLLQTAEPSETPLRSTSALGNWTRVLTAHPEGISSYLPLENIGKYTKDVRPHPALILQLNDWRGRLFIKVGTLARI